MWEDGTHLQSVSIQTVYSFMEITDGWQVETLISLSVHPPKHLWLKQSLQEHVNSVVQYMHGVLYSCTPCINEAMQSE